MPSVLYLTDPDRDYAADFLYHGFCELFGPGNVIDWPPKDSLHGRWGSDEPLFDCDLNLPRHKWFGGEVDQALADRRFDLIVVPTLRPGALRSLAGFRDADLLSRNRDVVVAYDGEDSSQRTDHYFTAALGFSPAAYFKRELPVGETWARSLPFGYPAERVMPVGERQMRVAAFFEVWDWAIDGMRGKLGRRLVDELGEHLDVNVSGFGATPPLPRLSVAEYHGRQRRCMAAVVPAGRGWFTNRLFDCVADGCMPIIETWSLNDGAVQFADEFVDGVDCREFRGIEECIGIIKDCCAHPDRTLLRARKAQETLLACHTTGHRAQTVWSAVHGRVPVGQLDAFRVEA